jgi:hypothetical protein
MAFAEIPLNSTLLKNVEEEATTQDITRLFNGYLDELGYVNRRPGLETAVIDITGATLGSATTGAFQVNGNYFWKKNGYGFIVCNGNLYKVSNVVSGSGYDVILTLITSSFTLSKSERIYWASDGTRVYLADGTDIYYTNGTTLTRLFDTDADCPRNVKQIAWLDGYIIAIKGTENKFYYSDVNNGLSWSAVDFASGTGSPDNIIALRIKARDIYLFGPDSIEIWRNDGVNPFTRVGGGFFNTGCLTPDAIQAVDDGFYWFDGRRRLISLTGSGIEKVSLPIDKELSGFDSFECRSELLEIEGKSFLIFRFLTQDRTLVLERTLGSWSEWTCHLGDGAYIGYLASEIVYYESWNLFIAGHNEINALFKINPTNIVNTDSVPTIGVQEINTLTRTGHLDFGVPGKKISRRMTMRLKRGAIGNGTEAGGDTEPYLVMRYKQDNKEWGNEVQVGLGLQGNTEIIKELWIRGHFRTRQYEFYVTDNTKVLYGAITQYFDVLDADR